MNDQDVIDRLRRAVNGVARDVSPDPPELDPTMERVSGGQDEPHRRPWVVAVAAATVTATVGAGLWVVAQDRDSDGRLQSPPASTPTSAPAPAVTPAGWYALEYGDVRLAVPHVPCDAVDIQLGVELTCDTTVVRITERTGPADGTGPMELTLPTACRQCTVAFTRLLGFEVVATSPDGELAARWSRRSARRRGGGR